MLARYCETTVSAISDSLVFLFHICRELKGFRESHRWKRHMGVPGGRKMFSLPYLLPMWRSCHLSMIPRTQKRFLMSISLLIGSVSFVNFWPLPVTFLFFPLEILFDPKGLFGNPHTPTPEQVTGRGDLEDSYEHPNSITKGKL